MYESYFSLKENPFSIAPDTRYLYLSPTHSGALLQLQYAISRGGCFQVVTGKVGVGKTTICRKLIEDLEQDVELVFILNPVMDERGFILSVCDELKIDYCNKDNDQVLYKRLYAKILNLYANNTGVVIVIDEAQHLSYQVLEKIRLLTNLEPGAEKIVQVVLLGQNELCEILHAKQSQQIAQRISSHVHIDALSAREVEKYIAHRLGVAGVNEVIFTRSASKLLCKYAEGIPRKINILADYALHIVYVQGKKRVSTKEIKQAKKEVFIDNVKRNNSIIYVLTAIAVFFASIYGFKYFNTLNVANKTEKSQYKMQDSSTQLQMGDMQAKKTERRSIKQSVKSHTLESILSTIDILPKKQFVREALLTMWGEDAHTQGMSEVDFCTEIEVFALQCHVMQSWNQLREFNRAAVVSFQYKGTNYSFLLRNMRDYSAQIEMYGKAYLLNFDELNKITTSMRILSLWRPIHNDKAIYAFGERGEHIKIIREQVRNALRYIHIQQLNKTDYPLKKVEEKNIFNSNMLTEVKRLQQRLSLRPDGIIGRKTQMAINQVLFSEVIPTLHIEQ